MKMLGGALRVEVLVRSVVVHTGKGIKLDLDFEDVWSAGGLLFEWIVHATLLLQTPKSSNPRRSVFRIELSLFHHSLSACPFRPSPVSFIRAEVPPSVQNRGSPSSGVRSRGRQISGMVEFR